jgi:hypothetical protein
MRQNCGFCERVNRFFGGKPKNAGNVGFDGLFHVAYERKSLPDPGAQVYAYESLGLVQFAPSGPSVFARDQVRSVSPQLYVFQQTLMAGIPIVSGQMVGQPLYDPNAGGYTQDPPGAISPLVPYNIPATTPDYPPAYAPNITSRTRVRPGM